MTATTPQPSLPPPASPLSPSVAESPSRPPNTDTPSLLHRPFSASPTLTAPTRPNTPARTSAIRNHSTPRFRPFCEFTLPSVCKDQSRTNVSLRSFFKRVSRNKGHPSGSARGPGLGALDLRARLDVDAVVVLGSRRVVLLVGLVFFCRCRGRGRLCLRPRVRTEPLRRSRRFRKKSFCTHAPADVELLLLVFQRRVDALSFHLPITPFAGSFCSSGDVLNTRVVGVSVPPSECIATRARPLGRIPSAA